MKKTLLLLGFVLATIAANAQTLLGTPLSNNTTQKERVLKAPSKAALHRLSVPKDEKPTYNPEGEDEAYIMAYTENNGFYEKQYTNGKVTVRQDGTTYYFNGLTPGGNRDYRGAEESWLKGEKVGNEIVIKAGQVLVQNDAKTLYLEIVHADEEGNVTSFEKEARLAIGEQGELYLTCNMLREYKSHTWLRNSRSIGVTLCYAKDAILAYKCNPVFGAYPPTMLQVDQMAMVVAILCHELEVEINNDTVLTHAEAASRDQYGPGQGDPDMRWDLYMLKGMPETRALRPGGVLLRKKALAYLHSMLRDKLLQPYEAEVEQPELLAA